MNCHDFVSSSAVAKRPCDAWYLSVVSFIASIVQYLAVFFINSYFDFKFTSTYNSILFCCLRRNVEPCCHTHDSHTTMNVYSARRRLVCLALYTVTDNRDCVQCGTTMTVYSVSHLVVQYPQ